MDYQLAFIFLALVLRCAVEADENLLDAGRIVGGLESEPASAPYVVTISIKGRQKNKQLCAGSIIAKQWIITGAHCLKDPPYRLIITAGVHSINDTEASALQIKRCDFYRRHDNYSTILGATGGSDIGLAHLGTPLEFTKFVQPILLSEKVKAEGQATVFGWGSVSSTIDRSYPSTLQVANLTMLDSKICEYAHNTTISEGTLCAGGKTNNRGACIGDSGGPLVQNGRLLGIISWGPPSCDPVDGPSVFTNVGYNSDWVKKQLSGELSETNLLK